MSINIGLVINLFAVDILGLYMANVSAIAFKTGTELRHAGLIDRNIYVYIIFVFRQMSHILFLLSAK
jgi:hypothetical protein